MIKKVYSIVFFFVLTATASAESWTTLYTSDGVKQVSTSLITVVQKFTDLEKKNILVASVNAIPSAGISSVFRSNEGNFEFCRNAYLYGVRGSDRRYGYCVFPRLEVNACWIGSKVDGFLLANVFISLECYKEEGNTSNTALEFVTKFDCVMVSQRGEYDSVMASLSFSAVNDNSLFPMRFELSSVRCDFDFSLNQQTFAYGDKLFSVTDLQATNNYALTYQLQGGTWPALFGYILARSATAFTTNVNGDIEYSPFQTAGNSWGNAQAFTMSGSRVVPRMWYRSNTSDIPLPAGSAFSLIDTDGGGQYDFSEYFYRKDCLNALDDDPNYQEAESDIVNIAIDNGYISIDNVKTDLPTTTDVNIDADPAGRVESIRDALISKLASNNIYNTYHSLLTGFTGDISLPMMRLPAECFGIFGDLNIYIDFNVIKENQNLWRIFMICRGSLVVLIIIVSFWDVFSLLNRAVEV